MNLLHSLSRLKKSIVSPTITFLLFFNTISVQGQFAPDSLQWKEAMAYADSILQDLSLKEKVSQLVMPMIWPKNDQATWASWKEMVNKESYGGVLWQKGLPEDQLALTNYMRKYARIPMMVAIDGEWGLSMRLSKTVKWPRNMVLGATANEQLAYAYGVATAKEALKMGVHVNFAPVIDINSNPENPVIGTRSYGSDASLVTRLGIAYAKGLERTGILSTAKHFPGHGDTSSDSHKTLPVIKKSRAELDSVELIPFRHYIQNGLGGIMVAHLKVPALGATAKATSATAEVVTTLLQKELGFKGLIFTDGLGMKGIIQGVGGASVAVSVFQAGADVLLAPENPRETVSELLTAVKNNIISEKEVTLRARKIVAYKYCLGAFDRTPLRSKELIKSLSPSSAIKLREEIYQSAITLAKNEEGFFPILKGTSLAIINLGGKLETNTLAQTFKSEGVKVESFTLTGKESKSKKSALFKRLNRYDRILLAVSPSKHHINTGDLLPLVKSSNVSIALFSTPYDVRRFQSLLPNIKGVVFAYDTTVSAQRATALASVGKITFKGKLPVDLSPCFSFGTSLSFTPFDLPQVSPESMGFDANKLMQIDSIALRGITDGAYPGCQILVARRGKIVYHKAFGYKDARKQRPNDKTTLYDLASITKAVVTVPLVMLAVAEGKLSLTATLGQYLPHLRKSDKEKITIRSLLYHTSHLPAGIPFYKALLDSTSFTPPLFTNKPGPLYTVQIESHKWGQKDWRYNDSLVSRDSSALYPIRFAKGYYLSSDVRPMIQKMIRDVKLQKKRAYHYSDLNFILLQDVLEAIYQKRLDQLFSEKVLSPLEIVDLFYLPYRNSSLSRLAEGQTDLFLRKQILLGDVDDESAAMLGGVSGNAGLYGSAYSLAKVVQLIANGGSLGGKKIIPQKEVRRFTTARIKASPFALGFDRQRAKNKPSNLSEKAPMETYGHTGFTGTCFWIDPINDLTYIFLSNRGTPERWNPKIIKGQIRKKIQTLIYSSLRK